MRKFLDAYSEEIWRDVTSARAMRLVPFGEVGVTDRLHLRTIQGALASTRGGHGGVLSGVIYDETDETVTGADWEWVVQLPNIPGQPKYLFYRIQAKILDRIKRPSNRQALLFSHLNQRNGNQMPDLIAQAANVGAHPFYCFYIGDPWPTTVPIALPPWPARWGLPTSRRQFGATVVPARRVQQIFNSARPKNEATQYLSLSALPGYSAEDLRFGIGRRLSDLFPGGGVGPGVGGAPGGGAPGGGGGGAPGGVGGGDVPGDGDAPYDLVGPMAALGDLAEMATDLMRPEQAPYLREIEQVRAYATPTTPWIHRESEGERDGRPRYTIYTLLERNRLL